MQRHRELYEMEARVCQVLANPKRLEILYALKDQEMTAGQLARAVDVTMPNLSQHLSLMKQYGMVESRKAGLNIHYRLGSEQVLNVCQLLRRLVTDQLTKQSALLALAAANVDPGKGNGRQE